MKNAFIGFRLGKELKNKLVEQAKNEGKTLSKYIVDVLRKASTN